MKKFVSILMTVTMLCMAMCSITLAAPATGAGKVDSSFKPSADMGDDATKFANKILGFVQWAGYAIAVGMLIYVGIKYVMASANEKADLKNSLIKYVIGAVLIAGAATISQWIFNIGG